MGRYLQKLSFGIDHAEWWVGWEIVGTDRPIHGLVQADSIDPEEIRKLGVTTFQRVTPEFLSRLERRTVHRIRLNPPLSGRIGSTPVLLVDLSAGGAGIAHERPLRPGKVMQLDLLQFGRFYTFAFEVVRSRLARGAIAQGEARYYSSLALRPGPACDKKAFESLVAEMVLANEPAIRNNPGEALAFF